MEKQEYRITIDAPKEKVWKALWVLKITGCGRRLLQKEAPLKLKTGKKEVRYYFLMLRDQGWYPLLMKIFQTAS